MRGIKILCVMMAVWMFLGAAGGCDNTSDRTAQDSKSMNRTAQNDIGTKTSPQKHITLKVSLGAITPTREQFTSTKASYVFTSTYIIAEEYMKKNPNVTIEWDYNVVYSNVEEWIRYMTPLIASGGAPDIVYGWNNANIYKNWYMDLTPYFYYPNKYIEGNKKWKETMPEYLFGDVCDVNGKIMGVPVTVFPGPSIAYFYNKRIFKELSLQEPKTWEELKALVKKAQEAGYVGFGTDRNANIRQIANNWDVQFVLGPPYGEGMRRELDYDGNGRFSSEEIIRAIYEKKFSAVDNPVGQEFWKNMRIKYEEILPPGYQGIDFKKLWNEGKLAIYEDGLWALPHELSNKQRPFDFGMIPPVVIAGDSSNYVAKIPYSEAGPYRPPLMEAYHVIDPRLQGKDAAVGEAAVDFLQFLTTPENLNSVILERRGACIGAVMGTDVPPELDEWFANRFPEYSTFRWYAPLTTEACTQADRLLQRWFKNEIADQSFYEEMDEIYVKSAKERIKANNIDISNWNK